MNLNYLTKSILAVVVLLGLANLVFTNVLATGGRELKTVLAETETIQKDNHYLKNQIAQATSLASIELKATNAGFIQISHTLAVTTPAPVAYVAQ